MARAKLVRDRIPEIIKSAGGNPATHTASDDEYQEKLGEKLCEEVAEYLADRSGEELADILEVVYALGKATGMTEEELRELREKKAAERGAFRKRIILEES